MKVKGNVSGERGTAPSSPLPLLLGLAAVIPSEPFSVFSHAPTSVLAAGALSLGRERGEGRTAVCGAACKQLYFEIPVPSLERDIKPLEEEDTLCAHPFLPFSILSPCPRTTGLVAGEEGTSTNTSSHSFFLSPLFPLNEPGSRNSIRRAGPLSCQTPCGDKTPRGRSKSSLDRRIGRCGTGRLFPSLWIHNRDCSSWTLGR